jgi:hypothetical protein
MNSKLNNIKILTDNFFKKYKQFENNFLINKILFFKNINYLIYSVIDYCIKENIINIKNIYGTYSEFIYLFNQELIHYLFSNININEPCYFENVKLFNKNSDDTSYYNDYEININDYGTINTYQSCYSNCSSKFKQECDKISLYIYVIDKQNKFHDFIKKLEDFIIFYSLQK